jgi:Glycosyl transferase family 2
MITDLQLPLTLDDVELPEQLPPIVVVAFTRPDLLQHVLNALGQQTLLPPKIIAFIDGPRSDKDKPAIQACITLFQEFAPTIPVEIVAREQNLGCDRNVVAALTEVFSTYPALVYLEDDVVPVPCFYDRICRLLAAYRDQHRVFSVSAYANFPDQLAPTIQSDFIVSRRVFSLGFATWADRWQEIGIGQQPQGYNPFKTFAKIPATIQTQSTIVNQFFLEKNKQTDWVITMTLGALFHDRVHITPTTSFVRNIGFGHPEAKTYSSGGEPDWANAKYDPHFCPNRLPQSLELPELLATPLTGVTLAQYLTKCRGIWLSPAALGHFLRRSQNWHDALEFVKLFAQRSIMMLKRWRSGLPV